MKTPATAETGGASAKAKQQTTDTHHSAKPSRPQVPAQKQPPPSPAPTVDLAALRARLVAARLRLIGRLVEDFPPDRRFPDSGWSRLLADIEICIQAVDGVVAETAP